MPHGISKREFSLVLPDRSLREMTAIHHASFLLELNLGHLYKWNISNRYQTPAKKGKMYVNDFFIGRELLTTVCVSFMLDLY